MGVTIDGKTGDDNAGPCTAAGMTLRNPRGTFGRLLTDRRGAIVIKFAVVLPVLLGLVGGVIDYTTYIGQKQKLQAAADSASTAAALARIMHQGDGVDHGGRWRAASFRPA